LAEIRRTSDPFNVTPDEDCISHWEAHISGPENTPYACGKFLVDISFPAEYPFRPPHVTFRSPIFHPNISLSGAICLDILKAGSGAWSPLITVPDLLRSIQSLLNDPNPDDPLNVEAATLYVTDPRQFNRRAESDTARYCSERTGILENQVIEDPKSYLQVTREGRVIDEDEALSIAIRSSIHSK
jgi:ubiquitin-conjugating enzyme E2 D/E